MKLSIDPEFRSLIPPLSAEELGQLEANIKADGCRDPLVTWNGLLLDGHNRYEICGRLGLTFKTIEIDLSDRDAAADWIDNNQLGRRNLTPDQASLLRGRRYNRAKRAHGGDRKSSGQTDHLKQKTAESLAKQHGVSAKTIRRDAKKADFVQRLEKESPEKAKAIKDGKKRIVEVAREIKEERRENRRIENREIIAATPGPVAAVESGARFATIVIDPPWDWGDEGDVDQMGRARPTYGTMPFEDVRALPVAQFADEDCHLYLWITNRSLPKGFELMDAWGFRYVTCVTWCKPSIGMGNYFRGSTEHLLFGVKGSQQLNRKDVGTWFAAPRGTKGHSSKPAAALELIESCSPGPYLEMFARSARKGWISWGAEAA